MESKKTNWTKILSCITKSQIAYNIGKLLLVSFGVFLIMFGLIRLIPGDPVDILLGDKATEELRIQYREMLGLEGSVFEQFGTNFNKILHGDLGTSVITRQSVNSIVKRAFPPTAWLIVVSLVISLLIAIPLGVLVAIYRGRWIDKVFHIASSVLLSIPGFYMGLLLILLFAVKLGIAPVAGYVQSFPANLQYLWLPALTISAVMVPILARVLQSSISDTLEQEFVETAIVRGLPRKHFIWRYLLRPSLAPTISLLGYMIGQMLGAAVVVEIVFNIPGIGTSLVVEGVLQRDYSLVQGIAFIFGLIVVVISFLSESISAWLDPRGRLS